MVLKAITQRRGHTADPTDEGKAPARFPSAISACAPVLPQWVTQPGAPQGAPGLVSQPARCLALGEPRH